MYYNQTKKMTTFIMIVRLLCITVHAVYVVNTIVTSKNMQKRDVLFPKANKNITIVSHFCVSQKY